MCVNAPVTLSSPLNNLVISRLFNLLQPISTLFNYLCLVTTEMKSQLVVPLSSHVLNLAMKEAVRANMKIEDWIAQVIETNASQDARDSAKRNG